ncbi:hypothetical protein [Sporosarcina sp. G11-34]|uniref:hypothetical protein n=1 Tax=Sporosarcina sp. G11-34 TaxID=2849605 RepID=UPI0022A8F23F|nr:hypothetical protein [Sporosarcina sp. G11-34]MCZ2257202.1 hypothetical protein [Sporosarcina sp. G11-34]
MVYLLRVRPLQSEQYANGISKTSYNFGRNGRLQQVKLKLGFQKKNEGRLHFQFENNDTRRDNNPFVVVYPPRLSKR